MTTFEDVKVARRELLDAIYAMVLDIRFRVSARLAQDLDEAWDKYDMTLVAFTCPENNDE